MRKRKRRYTHGRGVTLVKEDAQNFHSAIRLMNAALFEYSFPSAVVDGAGNESSYRWIGEWHNILGQKLAVMLKL